MHPVVSVNLTPLNVTNTDCQLTSAFRAPVSLITQQKKKKKFL